MKKSIILTLALVLLVSISGTTFAANISDVPAKHWAYDAVSQLSKDGLIEGFGDGTFRGDKSLTRYEFAMLTARALEKYSKADAQQKALIDKLSIEFVTELNIIGVRLNKLEKSASSVKFTGWAEVEGMTNCSLSGTDAPIFKPQSHLFDEIVQLNMTTSINDKVNFIGSVFGKNTVSNFTPATGKQTSSTTDVIFNTAYFTYKMSPDISLAVGREPLSLSQSHFVSDQVQNGKIGVDDIRLNFKYGKISGFVSLADITQHEYSTINNTAADSNSVKIGNLVWDPNAKFEVTAGAVSPNSNNYPYKLSFIGAAYKFDANWRILGDYVKNNFSADTFEPEGVVTKFNYKGANPNNVGSWGANIGYFKVGANAIDHNLSTICAWRADTGIKGIGVGIGYTLAKNVTVSTYITDFKAYNGSTSYTPSTCTNIQFLF
jgi:hypothetical protein